MSEYRLSHREVVDRAIAEFCRTRTRAELEGLGREHDVAITRVFDIGDIAQDPHYRERRMFLEWDDPVAGRVKGAGVAPKFSATPGGVWRGAPWLGQDNDRVLGELLGYSRDWIDALGRAGVIGADPPHGPPAAPPTPFTDRGV